MHPYSLIFSITGPQHRTPIVVQVALGEVQEQNFKLHNSEIFGGLRCYDVIRLYKTFPHCDKPQSGFACGQPHIYTPETQKVVKGNNQVLKFILNIL